MNRITLFLCLFSSIVSFGQKDIQSLLETGGFVDAYVEILSQEKNVKMHSEEYYTLQEYKSEVFWGLELFDSLESHSVKWIAYFDDRNQKLDTLVVTPLSNLGGLAFYEGRYTDAILAFDRINKILIHHHLMEEESFAQLHNNLGLLYSYVGDFENSLKSLHFSETYFLKGGDTGSLALVELNLGNSYHSLYRYGKASYYYKKAKLDLEHSKQGLTIEYFNVHLNISSLYADKGEYDSCLFFLEKAKSIAVEVEGEQSLSFAKVLNNYGECYKGLGEYGKAEYYLLQSIALKKDLLSESHPDYLLAMNNLAMLESSVGRYKRAEDRLRGILETAERTPENYQDKLADFMNNMASNYSKEDYWRKAESYYKKSLGLTKEIKGREGEYYATMQNLIVLYLSQKKYSKAEELLLEIPQAELDKMQARDIANYYNSRAFLYKRKKEFSEAEKSYKKALEILGEEGSVLDVAAIKVNIGVLQSDLGKVSQAAGNLEEGLSAMISNVLLSYSSFTENEKELFLNTVYFYSQYYYLFILKNYKGNSDLVKKCLGFRLQTKSLALRSTQVFEENILKSTNEKAKEELEVVFALKKEIAKYASLTSRQLKQSRYPLEKKKNQLQEKEKVLYFQYGGVLSNLQTKGWRDIQKQLKAEEATIEIIRTINESNEASYFAILLKKEGDPIIVEIQNGKDLEKKKYSYYQQTTRLKIKDELSYKSYWGAIKQHLSGINKVYFSPDGIYHKINLNTLFNLETNEFLIDEIEITYKLSLNDLTMVELKDSKGIRLFGHPSYYLDLKGAIESIEKNETPVLRTVKPEFEEWSDLPGTKEEVEKIGQILKGNNWDVEIYTEEKALENTVKKLESPGVLHIATHGWFSSKEDSVQVYDENYFESPLLRNGLVFSGGGLHLTPLDIESSYFEDGVLTANEARLLDLSSTSLVVLSACQTGLGDLRNEEGVFGLQRSFRMAGAESMIMSLWSVDDEATKELMVSFYTNLSKSGDIAVSFKKAMKDIKEKYESPFYWGAFILLE